MLRRTQFWVRKTFSKPASLKRASLVALPVAISHKVSLKPKLCASATLIQKTSKNEPKHGPKNGTAWRSHFWDRMHSLVKEQKKSTFTVPFLGPSGGTKNETAKSQNPQQRPTLATNKNCNCIYLSNQHIDLEQYTCKVFTCTKLSQGHRAILCFLLHPQDLPAQMADSFFLSEPVAFRRVYGLESYSRTSGESNHHRQSVSDTRMPRYQLSHEDDSRSNGGLVRCPVCLQVGGQRNWQCIWMCSTSSRILG